MKNLFSTLLCMIFLLSACQDKKETETYNEINIALAMDNLTELKVSDFGKTIRYIPLETKDECLINRNPDLRILKDKIIVITQKQCFAFNKADGKFVSEIGHIGEDPEGYSSTYCWLDETEEILYFQRLPNQLMKYDTRGNFLGKIELKDSKTPSFYVIKNTGIIGAFNNVLEPNNNILRFFHPDGAAKDSIPSMSVSTAISFDDILSISVLKNTDMYGNWARHGIIFIESKEDKRITNAPLAEVLWSHKNKTRFKQTFCDTIYTVNESGLNSYLTFNTGKWHWPENEKNSTKNNNQRLLIPYVTETDNHIFFQCIQGLYTSEAQLYNGLYDKTTKITKLSKHKDGIKDDLTAFLPLQLITSSRSDEFAGFVEAPDALEWLEENPQGTEQKELSFLNDITEDMNPIVVLIH